MTERATDLGKRGAASVREMITGIHRVAFLVLFDLNCSKVMQERLYWPKSSATRLERRICPASPQSITHIDRLLAAGLLHPDHRKGPRRGTGPIRSHARRRLAPGLVNRCLRHGDLDVGANRDPEAVRLRHNELDHSDLDTVRRLDNSVE